MLLVLLIYFILFIHSFLSFSKFDLIIHKLKKKRENLVFKETISFFTEI